MWNASQVSPTLRYSPRISAPLALGEDNFFTQAEKSILQRHRDELGHLLYEQCFKVVSRKSVEESLLTWNGGEEEEFPLRTSSYGRNREIERLEGIPSMNQGFKLVGCAKADASILKISELACELMPSFDAFLVHALLLNEFGDSVDALCFLNEIDGMFWAGRKKKILLQNRTMINCSIGDLGAAVECSRSAISQGDPRVIDAFNLLSTELVAGSEKSILFASSLMEEVGVNSLDSIDVLVSAVLANRHSFLPNIQGSQRKLISKIKGRLHSTARLLVQGVFNERF